MTNDGFFLSSFTMKKKKNRYGFWEIANFGLN